MRIKNFTLMLMAVLFSAVGFAQKSVPAREAIAVNRLAKVLPVRQMQSVQKLAMPSAVMPALVTNPQSKPAPRAAAKSPAKAPEVVTPPASGEVEYYTLSGTNNRAGKTSLTVKVVWDDEDEDVFYVNGLSYYIPEAFVKGTFKDDNTVIFENGQYLGQFYDYDFYLNFANPTTFEVEDAEVAYDETEGKFTFSDFILETDDPTSTGYYAYWSPGVTLVPVEGDVDVPVEIPSDLEYERYVSVGKDYFEDDADFSDYVNVGLYGKVGEGCEVYIQGMSADAPEAWIKGTFVDETTVSFPSGQMLDEELYFVAIDDNFDVAEAYELIYDPKTGAFSEGSFGNVINVYKDSINRSVHQYRYNYEIKPISERAATPGLSRISSIAFKPSGDALLFNLAKVDTDDEGLVDELLSYKVYYMDAKGEEYPVTFTKAEYPSLREDLEEIPATLTDGSDFLSGSVNLKMEDHRSWTMIGIQGIYYGEKERNESKIAWYTPTWPITVTLPEGLTVTEHTFSGELYDSDGNEPFERTVGLAFDGDDMYIRGIGETVDTLWVKGTKNAEGAYVFPKGQSIGIYNKTYCLFLVGYENDAATDVIVTEDGSKYTIETTFLENANYTDRSYYLNRFVSGATIFKAEAGTEVPELVEVPEDLETETWLFKGTDYFAESDDEAAVARPVAVGFYGDDEVYVQGLSETFPNAWVKGLVEEDEYGDHTVSFASGQYLGKYRGRDCWFIGYNMNKGKVVSYVMDFDEQTSTMSKLTEDMLFGVNTYKAKVQSSLREFYHTTAIKKIVERAATPVKPYINNINYSKWGPIAEFSIPTMDTEDEGLIDSLISYKLYYDEGDGEAKEVTFTTESYPKLTEDMTVVPYGFLDDVDDEGNPDPYDFGANFVYLNMDMSTWARIGIQSIYSGGGETNASEIGWYTPTWPIATELPEGAEVSVYSFSGTTVEDSGNVPFSKAVNVAFVENDVYIQGVGDADEEAWIKGTKNPETNVYTFARGQELGTYSLTSGSGNLYLIGYNENLGVMDVRMTFDPETGTLTTTNELVENADYTDKLYYLTRVDAKAVFAPVEMDRAATPEVPAISTLKYYISKSNNFTSAMLDIPLVDVDGVPLADTLLTYKLYYDEGDSEAKLITFTTDLYQELEADMSEIPYGFIDDSDFFKDLVYLNMDMSTWKRIGIQAIYSGGGETNASEIGWYTPTWPTIAEPADDVETKIYDFFGTDLDDTNCAVGGLKVAMEGDKVYVQSMFENSQYWIVGTKDENNIYTFDLGQYLGNVLGDDGYPYSLFLTGYNTTSREAEALQMSYNEETGVFTTLNLMLSNSDYTDLVDYSAFSIFKPGAQLVPGDGPDAITSVEANAEENAVRFNIAGQRVGKNYKGLIVEKGRKFLQK